jgi:lipopolysaccharide transport system ATP-binding protein
MSCSDIAVSVRGLSKSYTIAHNAVQHSTLAEQVLHRVRHPFAKAEKETFWALKNVEFDIQKGDIVGIIGRNGAGKSTLLKVLSRITEPTAGQIDVYGRIGSLLEVGTGFHPELTGRENIYLNGQILGMRKKEIESQFDAIVDFSGCEQFLDTPVKRYSSGMYVRLAFAVAAHLSSEILVVDEVLAVGDSEFQKKCLGKMKDVASGGRTVLFVSHNMAAVEGLCGRAILLRRGNVEQIGETPEVIAAYQKALRGDVVDSALARRKDRSGDGRIKLTRFWVEDDAGEELNTVRSGQTVVFAFEYEAANPGQIRDIEVGMSIGHGDHNLLSVLYNNYEGQSVLIDEIKGTFRCTVHNLALSAGRYIIGARIFANGTEADWPRDGVGEIAVEAGDFYGTGHVGAGSIAPILMRGTWTCEPAIGNRQRYQMNSNRISSV